MPVLYIHRLLETDVPHAARTQHVHQSFIGSVNLSNVIEDYLLL
jgi:hypothetical protein